MKLVVANSSGKNIWAAAYRVDADGSIFTLVEFYLAGDPVDGVVPEPVPAPPDCITVDVPDDPIQYSAPEGFVLKIKFPRQFTTPAGENGLLVEIADIVPEASGAKGPPN